MTDSDEKEDHFNDDEKEDYRNDENKRRDYYLYHCYLSSHPNIPRVVVVGFIAYRTHVVPTYSDVSSLLYPLFI